jgi:hypothetical protein
MARLYVHAEGATEQAFVREILTEHLAARGVYVQGAVRVATKRERGKVHRGGGRHYMPMKNDIVCFLKQEKATDVFFTTMIDLYGLYADFPGREAADNFRHEPYERVRRLEQAFAADIPDPRFIPYLQLHEFEALLFADPSAFAYVYENCQKQLAALQEMVEKDGPPELINDGPQTAPSKRVRAQFADYQKPVVGPALVGVIGLDGIRKKCPHFNEWLTRLESLGERPAS